MDFKFGAFGGIQGEQLHDGAGVGMFAAMA
jgi:hypothetical protein